MCPDNSLVHTVWTNISTQTQTSRSIIKQAWEKELSGNTYFIYLSSTIITAATPVKNLPRITMSSNTIRTTGICRPSDCRQSSAMRTVAADPHPSYRDTRMV